jgi:hypothetical protein
MDSGFNQLVLAPVMMMLAAGYERETDSGYEKGTKVNEFPAFEKWDSDNKDGELNVVVNRRFIMKVDGNNIADPKVLREFAQAADLAAGRPEVGGPWSECYHGLPGASAPLVRSRAGDLYRRVEPHAEERAGGQVHVLALGRDQRTAAP